MASKTNVRGMKAQANSLVNAITYLKNSIDREMTELEQARTAVYFHRERLSALVEEMEDKKSQLDSLVSGMVHYDMFALKQLAAKPAKSK